MQYLHGRLQCSIQGFFERKEKENFKRLSSGRHKVGPLNYVKLSTKQPLFYKVESKYSIKHPLDIYDAFSDESGRLHMLSLNLSSEYTVYGIHFLRLLSSIDWGQSLLLFLPALLIWDQREIGRGRGEGGAASRLATALP